MPDALELASLDEATRRLLEECSKNSGGDLGIVRMFGLSEKLRTLTENQKTLLAELCKIKEELKAKE